MAAALGTSGIFAGFTLMALKAKRKSMLMLGGPLLGGLLCLVLCSLGGMFLPMLGVTNPAVLGVCNTYNMSAQIATDSSTTNLKLIFLGSVQYQLVWWSCPLFCLYLLRYSEND